MRTYSAFAVLLAGIALGATSVVACSDDAPPDADAAACDCPAAEPPLQGRIISQTATVTIPANDQGRGSVNCPQGGTLLGGACSVDNAPNLVVVNDFHTLRGDPQRPGFSCSWTSAGAVDITGTVEAICLVPAP